jgi:sigma-B regulation protein RsbU (phosphoserine phosphatase)
VAGVIGATKGDQYKKILAGFLNKNDEESLYQAQQLSRKLLESKTSPEEIISLHYDALQRVFPDLTEDLRHSFEFLLEVMMGYGLAYREHQSLRHQQKELQSEIEVAANMQETLLKTETPAIDSLEVGAISVPARQMNGDYYHFVQDDNDCLGVAIADIIGKGIPAALCMSMIKYSMDSLPETRMKPNAVLESLNRVVEQNVDDSMFITMFYGMYDPRKNKFHYASAGHEPGYHFSKQKNCFVELSTKGLVLGVSRTTKYQQYNMDMEKGDMIVLLSDGVTECQTGDAFIERGKVLELIEQSMHLPAQKIVENVYQELEEMQDFQLRDDFTLIILRRVV